MKTNEVCILQRVYFKDPTGKQSGMGYVRSRGGTCVEVLLEKTAKIKKGHVWATVGTTIETHPRNLTPRGRVISFADAKGLKPIYEPWPA
jgi:hypothetical protein